MLLAALLMGEAVWFVAHRVGGDVGTDAAIRLIVGTRSASWSTSRCSSRSALPNSTSSVAASGRRSGQPRVAIGWS